jgi:hypothetical protein
LIEEELEDAIKAKAVMTEQLAMKKPAGELSISKSIGFVSFLTSLATLAGMKPAIQPTKCFWAD